MYLLNAGQCVAPLPKMHDLANLKQQNVTKFDLPDLKIQKCVQNRNHPGAPIEDTHFALFEHVSTPKNASFNKMKKDIFLN